MATTIETPRFHVYQNLLVQCLILWLAIVLLFGAERLLMFYYFVPENIRNQPQLEITALFIKGLLFDSKIASIAVALPFLLGLISLLHPKIMRLWQHFQAALLIFLFALASLAAISNWFYFVVYNHQFDVFIFGLFDEDTQAVLKTMWSDYPIVRSVLAILIMTTLFALLLRLCRLRGQTASVLSVSKTRWFAMILLPILLITTGIRGSFGKFPLRQSAAYISAIPQINKLVPNAMTSLSWAWNDYRNSNQFVAVSDSDGEKIISQLLGKPSQADLAQFQQKTPQNSAVEQQQPNVVFAVMESMSAHLLAFDTPERNLLGSLKNHWQEDWVYTKFVSEGDGTSDSLHRFFIRAPRNNVSQSIGKNKNFPTNLFLPYKAAGYRTIYLTAGNGSWRDFDNFVRHLGVDEVIDENVIKTRYPQAQSTTWGVPDEFMFRYAADELQRAQKENKPVFIMMMSITNHPPYHLPAPYKNQDFKLIDTEQNRLSSLAQGTLLNEIFNTYKYSNDQLGQFISTVKQNTPNTIIAATGDHNMRAISYPNPNEAALGHSVPFYLYVPKIYRSQAEYHPERAGSHKDIMPTLYALSLSQQNYYQTGCNLTAPQDSDETQSAWCGYGYNPEVLVLQNGFYHLNAQQFYTWKDDKHLIANHTPSTPNETEQAIIQKGSAYRAFLDWQLNRMVVGK